MMAARATATHDAILRENRRVKSRFLRLPGMRGNRPGVLLAALALALCAAVSTPAQAQYRLAPFKDRLFDYPGMLAGKPRYFYAMPYRERYIWGVTAGILRLLYETVCR